ncbi:hypothetical protein DVK00_16145 [Haloarcula sp. Atlit-47R]|uniref:hypothetical protein n=1 Tax=Haloarcula sp. Atlit-47R TaxID=2282132 RepID=UPI000EF1A987|nr:hypothetical protein [Haloarcula sp. Atlit-47R]RLM42587.1 hypothetical protein DVK00_16145 [Haloarcula sp. Atlit-47R]
MRIITHTCTECGTIVSANEVESNRVMKCPGLGCENVLKFEEIPKEEQQHFLENKDQYEI